MQELTNTLLATCENLVRLEVDWAAKNEKVIKSAFKKIEKKGTTPFTRAEKVALSEYLDIRFSSGKIVAYIYAMQQINGGRIGIPQEYPYLLRWIKNNMPAPTV